VAAMRSRRRTRYGTVIFWLVAGSMHFLQPRFYEAIVPPPLERYRRQVVVASGIAELVGGLAVLPSSTRRLARGWLLATLVAVYPANIYMALKPERFPRVPKWLLWARLPLQGLFAWITCRGSE
jgi:uncharacterized membrane protein